MKDTTLYLLCAFVSTECIVFNSTLLDSKIVGGSYPAKHTKRFMASLRLKSNHFCSGFLVSKRIVVSTAVCVHYMSMIAGPNLDDATILVGNTDRTKPDSGRIVDIKHTKYHPRFNPAKSLVTLDYNIGYLLLAEQLPKCYTIKAIQLNPRDVVYNLHGYMYGWGSEIIEDQEKSFWQISMSEKLKELRIVITSRTICNHILIRRLKDNEACAKGYTSGETATRGDTGSPMTRNSKVLGIVSTVNAIGQYKPMVILKIKPFIPYIEQLKNDFPDEEQNDRKEECAMVDTDQECEIQERNALRQLPDLNEDYNELPDLNE